MRNPWQLLLIRNCRRSYFQVQSSSLSSSSSPFHHNHALVCSLVRNNHSHYNTATFRHCNNSAFPSDLASPFSINSSFSRACSSSPEIDIKQIADKDHAIVADIFSKEKGFDDIRKELDFNNLVVSYDFILKILADPNLTTDVARRFFNWLLVAEGSKLSSKSYNLMLSNLGVNGFANEFWKLVDTMKVKGYGVSKGAYLKVLDKFEKEGLKGDVEKLIGLYASGSTDISVEKVSSRLSKIIRSAVWSGETEARIRGVNVTFSNDLVKMLLESLATDPVKAFIFFRWVEESGLFKHDEKTYNAMLVVLGREDCIDRFWKVANEMRGAGYEMELDVYVKVLGRLLKRKLVKDAVDLHEFAMIGSNKPSVHDCTFLLKKIVVNNEFDMDLFSQAVRICKAGGNTLTNSMLDAVLKSLTTVGRFGYSSKIMKAMEEGGLLAKSTSLNRIAFGLSRAGEKDEACKFMEKTEASSNIKTWTSLIEGYCAAGDVDSASEYFHKMVQREDVSSADYALDLLVTAFCRNERAIDGCKVLSDIASQKELKPWHTTYKTLISRLLVQGKFDEALNLLGLMKTHGYPPYLDPFLKYISKTGTADDAIILLKAMTVKRFPSMPVFLRVFKAFFGAKRQSEAQNFLSKCPGYIRNHADVLDLFCAMKSRETTSASPAAA